MLLGSFERVHVANVNLCAGRNIVQGFAFLNRSFENLDVGQSTQIGIAGQVEDHSTCRAGSICCRSSHRFCDGMQQHIQPLAFGGRRTQYRHQFAGSQPDGQRRCQLVGRNRFFLEELHHQFVIEGGDFFQQDTARFFDRTGQISRNVLLGLVAEIDGLVLNQIYHSDKGTVFANGDLKGNELAVEVIAHRS